MTEYLRRSIATVTPAAIKPVNIADVRAHLVLDTGFYTPLSANSGAAQAFPNRIYIADTSPYEVGDLVWVCDDLSSDGEILRVASILLNTHLQCTTNMTGDYFIISAARVYPDAEKNDLLQGYIEAGTQLAEDYLGRALITRTLNLFQDFFWGDEIILPYPPLASCGATPEGVFTTDSDGVETRMTDTDYIVDTAIIPGRITLKEDAIWPTDIRNHKGIRVQYKAGYGTTRASVPYKFRRAILDLVSLWYGEREGGIGKVTPENILERLLTDMIKAL